jgi:hypothetical protein
MAAAERLWRAVPALRGSTMTTVTEHAQSLAEFRDAAAETLERVNRTRLLAMKATQRGTAASDTAAAV